MPIAPWGSPACPLGSLYWTWKDYEERSQWNVGVSMAEGAALGNDVTAAAAPVEARVVLKATAMRSMALDEC